MLVEFSPEQCIATTSGDKFDDSPRRALLLELGFDFSECATERRIPEDLAQRVDLDFRGREVSE